MASPESVPLVEATLNGIDGVEVHASNSGKLVVTVEGPNDRRLADRISEFSNIKGVLSTSLVYHEIDAENLNETSNRSAEFGQECKQ